MNQDGLLAAGTSALDLAIESQSGADEQLRVKVPATACQLQFNP